ncbi:MAG TPA: hypothetical protein VI248_28915 [Kineosporiaceae bacterium]
MAGRTPVRERVLGAAGRAGGAALACAVLAAGGLAGCADPTGDIDAEGHNGYDSDTCEQAKALALDILYRTVFPRSAADRVAALTADAAKASHPEIRQAATALVDGYRAGDRRAVTTATATLVRACQL